MTDPAPTPPPDDAAGRSSAPAFVPPPAPAHPSDDVLSRLLATADPAVPSPEFAARLGSLIVAGSPRPGRRRAARWAVFFVCMAGTFLVGLAAADRLYDALDRILNGGVERAALDSAGTRTGDRGSAVIAAAVLGRSPSTVVEAPWTVDRPVQLFVAGETPGAAEIAGVARLVLADVGAVRYTPEGLATAASLEVLQGRVEVASMREMELRVGGLAVAAHAGTVIEFAVTPRAEAHMKDRILAAAGGVVIGAAAVGLWLKQGEAELGGKAIERNRSAVYATDVPAAESRDGGTVDALKSDLAAARTALGDAQARAGSMKKELDAVKQELAALRAFDTEKKAVEIGAVLARLDALKKKGLTSLLDPVATADVVNDLKMLGPAGTKAMIDLLASEDKDARFLAARILESLGDPAAIPALKEASLKDSSEMVTSQASHALALMNDPAVAEPCREIYEASEPGGAKINALFGWARFGDERGVAEAVRYVTDGKVPAQFRAAIGQGFLLMADDKAMAVANAYVDDNRKEEGVTMLAVQYYARIGGATSRDRLRSLADDPNVPSSVRAAANAELSK